MRYCTIIIVAWGGVKIGKDCLLCSSPMTREPYLINIGNNVTVSTNVTFVTHDNSIKLLYPEKSDVFGKIVIGNNCFIGENATILYGVTLADNIIVAAGSVVTKSFRNSNIIIGGNPAHIINTWDKFSEKIKDNVITRKEMENCKERDSSFLISRQIGGFMYPLVSVIIPTYNRPTYLRRCLESVLNQTYKNIEIFVVDDNNPETEARIETEKIMNEYVNGKNVTYLKHNFNKNGSAARNTGWKHSSGKYITFLDDDDEIDESKIQKQVECLEKLDESWGACYTAYKLIKEYGSNQISTENRSGDCYVDALMRTMFMGSGSNLFLRKKVVDEIGGYDESFQRNQDIEFLVRVLENYKLAYVDEVLLTIYQEGNRVSRSFEQIDKYAKYYLEVFQDKINALNKSDRNRVIAVISLERCRVAFYKKKYKEGLKIILENNVKFKYIIRYIKYIIHRLITHESYGFNGL